MAKTQTKAAAKKAEAPKAPTAAVAAKKDAYLMLKSGKVEGKSGAVYATTAGKVLEVPAGDLDHLGPRYCEKK